MDFKYKARFFLWNISDISLARLTELLGIIPPRTWNAILKQQWLFSKRMEASKKLGIQKVFNTSTGKFEARLIK